MQPSEELKVSLLSGLKAMSKDLTPPYIHCSKINSVLTDVKQIIEIVESKELEVQWQSKNLVMALADILSQFHQLHSQCIKEVCAQFCLTTSLHFIHNEIRDIRNELEKILNKLGIPEAAQVIQVKPTIYESQNLVDVKRIAQILNQLQTRKDIARRPDVAKHLLARTQSLTDLGVTIGSEPETEVITIPELPESINFLVHHEDIDFGSQIGKGQSSRVVTGVLKTTGKTVAVKILHCRSLTPFEMEMFRREIFMMSVLRHPSLLEFYGYTSDPPFCVLLEYMPNGSLHDFLKNKPEQLSPTQRTLIAIDVARGMEYLHSRSIIHRDLKSPNVLLDDRYRAKLCDFGLVRVKGKDPMTGMIGTIYWMAPEVLRSAPFYDEKVDVYSYGVLLWEMLTNKLPYDGENQNQVLLEIIEHNRRPIIPKGTPAGLRRLIEECWSALPSARPSFTQIAQRLAQPDCQFPGGAGVVVSPSASFIHHVYSASSPAFAPRRQGRRTNSDYLRVRRGSFSNRDVERVGQAMAQGHFESFQAALTQLKGSLAIAGVDWGQYIPTLVALLGRAPPHFKPKLLQVVLEILGHENAIAFAPADFVKSLLESGDEATYLCTLSKLAARITPLIVDPPTVGAILGFASHPRQEVRLMALQILIAAADESPRDFAQIDGAIPRLLLFAARKMPNDSLLELLRTVGSLLGELSVIPDAVFTRLTRICALCPPALLPEAFRCLATALRVSDDGSKVKSVWNAACEHPWVATELFEQISKYPEFIEEGQIAALMTCGADAAPALSKLSSDERLAAVIASKLPLLPKSDSIASSLIPHRAKKDNNLNAAVGALYAVLARVPKTWDKLIRVREFYDVAHIAINYAPAEVSAVLRAAVQTPYIKHIAETGLLSRIGAILPSVSDPIPLLSALHSFAQAGMKDRAAASAAANLARIGDGRVKPLAFLAAVELGAGAERAEAEALAPLAAELAARGEPESVREAAAGIVERAPSLSAVGPLIAASAGKRSEEARRCAIALLRVEEDPARKAQLASLC